MFGSKGGLSQACETNLVAKRLNPHDRSASWGKCLGVLALGVQVMGHVAVASSSMGVLLAQHLLSNGQRLAEEGFGLGVLALGVQL